MKCTNRYSSNSRLKNGVICLVIMFTQEDFSIALKCFAQAVTNCLLSPAENTKRAMFYILITITLEVNMVLALLHFRTPLIKVKVRVRVKSRFFMMNHQ